MQRIILLLLFCLPTAQAFQSAFTCYNSTSTPKTIRSDGTAELISDIVLTCTGGTAGNRQVLSNLALSLNANVTSRILDTASNATEAMLFVDDPATPVLGQSLIQGTLTGANSLSFANIPIVEPGSATRTIRITNLRVNAAQLVAGSGSSNPLGQVVGFVSASVAIYNPQLTLANVARGLTFNMRDVLGNGITNLAFQQSGGVNNALAASSTAIGGVLTHTLQFSEAFNTAFSKRNKGTTAANPTALLDQNAPGTNYQTESGYSNSTLPATGGLNMAGLATQGTRLMAQFTNVPAGVALYVTVNQTAGPAARLVAIGAYSTITQTTTASGSGIAPVLLTAGSGSATWEVLEPDPSAFDKLQFGVAVAYAAPLAGSAAVTGVFAPISTVTTADNTSPLPRFSAPATSPGSQCSTLPCLLVPSVVTISYRVGDPLPSPVSFPIDTSGAPITFSWSSQVGNGTDIYGNPISPPDSNWLNVTPSGTVTPATFTVSTNPTNFYPGQYQASIALTSSGAGNGSQVVTILLNVLPSPSGTLIPFLCTSNAGVPPLIRGEGLTEALGDLILNCTGGIPGSILNVAPVLSLNTNFTSRIVNASTNTTEALLLIDEPTPATQKLGTNLFQGVVASSNSVSFGSIPITVPASGTRILRFTNIRADAKALGVSTTNIQTQVVTTISVPGISIQNPQQTTAYILYGKLFGLRTAADTPVPSMTFQQSGGSAAGNVSFLAKFSEFYSTAFRKRGSIDQATPGTSFNTESMFANSLFPSTNGLNLAGFATQGTRLMARFNNIPAGVTLYATVTNVNAGTLSAQLVSTDALGAGSYSAVAQTGTATYNGTPYGVAPIAVSNGNAIAVWEVLNSTPNSVEEARFGIVAAYAAPIAGSANVTGVLAPLSTVETADAVAPTPRYGDGACPVSPCPSIAVAGLPLNSGQSTIINTPFPQPLKLLVVDTNYNPIPGAAITFSTGQYDADASFPGGLHSASVISDSSGIATSPQLTANSVVGAYAAFASGNFSAQPAFSLTNLPVTYTISGQVTNASAVTMTLTGGSSATTTTNSSGNYSFPTLTPAASYTVTPSLAGYTFIPPTISISSLTSDQTVNFTARPNNITISGHITGAAGVLISLTGTQTATTTTNSSGDYSFTALTTGGTYTVTPSLAGYSFTPPSLTFTNAISNPTANFTGSLPPSVLSIGKTHSGNFSQGHANAAYTVTVTNAPAAPPTSSPVTVTESIPTGLTLVSMTGTGWTCTAATCTRSDVLIAGASYPPITVLVNVASNAPSSVTNSVTVSGGGSASANASDPTTVIVHNPEVGTLTPVISSGASQTFTFKFTDSFGAADLTVANVLINSSLDGRQACYLAYVQQTNTLFLVNDAGEPGGPFAGGIVLNGSGSINNSQCTIAGAGSSATVSGNTLTLTLNISFSSTFGGNKVIYLAARDSAPLSSGWQTMGAHGVPPLPSSFPNPNGMSPAAGAGASSTLTFTYQDASAATNLQTAWALINTAIDGRSACYVAYYRPANLLYLYPDNGDGNQATNIPLTGTNTIGNSQCTISAQGSSVTVNGAQLIVNLNIAFTHAFAGPKGVWMATQTMGGAQTSQWQALGAWQVP